MASIESKIIELCVFKRTKKGPLYLILKRASAEKVYPNICQIVTGKIKPDETAENACLRELKEETGLAQMRFWVVPIVSSFFDPIGDTIQLCPLFAVEVGPTAEPKLSSEHQSYVWASRSRAQQLLVWPGHRDAVQTVHNYIVADQEAGRLTELKPYLEKG